MNNLLVSVGLSIVKEDLIKQCCVQHRRVGNTSKFHLKFKLKDKIF